MNLEFFFIIMQTFSVTSFLWVAFIFNKSLLVSITVLRTPYLLKRMKQVKCFLHLLLFHLSSEVPYMMSGISLFQLYINQEVLK